MKSLQECSDDFVSAIFSRDKKFIFIQFGKKDSRFSIFFNFIFNTVSWISFISILLCAIYMNDRFLEGSSFAMFFLFLFGIVLFWQFIINARIKSKTTTLYAKDKDELISWVKESAMKDVINESN